MEYKKIDNEIIDNKKQINQIDNLIDDEKNKIKKIDSMKESAIAISKCMNQCINLLSESIKGPITDAKLNDMRSSNHKVYINLATVLDDEAEISSKNIHKLYETKENILKEAKKQKE